MTLLLAVATLASTSPPGVAVPAPGRLRLVSAGPDGAPADAASGSVSFSADGRFVAFSSLASNLVPGDANDVWDVFLLDRDTGLLRRVSRAAGAEENGNSSFPTVSADGRYVAFESAASNLVPGDTNEVSDVFLLDRETGALDLTSVALDGGPANGGSHFADVSDDGRYVSFYGAASNLVPGDVNGNQDVFVRDRATGTTELVSLASDGSLGNNSAYLPSMSGDGRFVAWESSASNIVPSDSNLTADVFLRDRQSRTTQRISVGPGAAQANDASLSPSVSADGRAVAFTSYASNLVPGDRNGVPDVFVRDLQAEATELVSISSLGTPGTASAFAASVSAEGRYVAFQSGATNLAPGDANGASDIFLHDREAGVTRRVSVGPGGEGNGGSFWPAVSPDGRFVGFQSSASNLVPGDANGLPDVLVDEGAGPVAVGGLTAHSGGEQISTSGWAAFAPAVLSGANDPANDAAAALPDAEILRAVVTYRPDEADLLFRVRLASMDAGPGLVYGMAFTVAGTRYEVRALAAGVTAATPGPYFALYRCDLRCTEQARLTGGIGTGAAAVVALPLSALGAGGGFSLTGITAFSAAGEAAPGGVVRLDEAALPAATIPAPAVSLGLAPAGTPREDVGFDATATISPSGFAGNIAAPTPGDHDLWARACLGTTCEATSIRLQV